MTAAGRISIVALGTLLAAALALAFVGSKVESKYGGPLKTISVAQNGLNELRLEIDEATAADLIANKAEAERYIYKVIPDNLSAAVTALEKTVDGTAYSLGGALSEEQMGEFNATIRVYSADIAGRASEKGEVTDVDFADVIVLCADAINTSGPAFLEMLQPEKDDKAIQVERAKLTLHLARFEMLLAYFTILVENAA